MLYRNRIRLDIFPAIRLALLFIWIFTSFSAANPAFAGPDEELQKLRKALIASNERQEEISARLQLLSSEIKALKKKAVRVGTRLVEIDTKMLKTEDRLTDIKQVESQTLETLSRQNKGLADTLSALLQLSRQPEGSLIGSPDNLINSLRTATLLKAAVAALKKDADALSDQLDTLATLRDQYLAEQSNIQLLKTSRVAEQNSLNSLLQSKKMTRTALSGLNAREAREQKKLSTTARDLVALISGLEKQKQQRLKNERRRIEKEIARQEKLQLAEIRRKAEEAKQLANKKALEESQNKSASTIVLMAPASKPKKSAKKTAEPSQESTQLALLNTRQSFFSAKGTLALPVGGKIISKYNSSRDVRKRNGIVIETRGNAAVVSPFDGQIAFAGPFRHYGLLLIIDHGEGYHTLLAGMGSIEGSVGQLLLAGEPVGQMNSSKSEKQALYMELRIKGSPVNPIPWLAAGNRKVSG